MLGQIGLMLLVGAAGWVRPDAFDGPWRLPAAWGCLMLGAVTGLGGVAALRGNRTIYPRPKPDSRLIQTGLYAWLRHPLYASLMALSASWAMFRGSWFVLGAGLLLAVFLRCKAAREERWLRAQFPDYADYARRVKRFIPGVW